MPSREPLPVDGYLDDVRRLVRQSRALVLTAAPGAGKTTRIPPSLAGDGPVLLLQPRRVAARSIAARIAFEQQWTIGREVGWHIRFEQRFSRETRLLVATEGILTARLQKDPLLSDFLTVVVDEFHERSIHGDIGLALARQAWLARDDLRIVVMSATMDAARVSSFLGECPIVEVPGRLFPVDVLYRPGVSIEDAIASELPSARGAVLAFLPGAGEIRRAVGRLEAITRGVVPIHELHGGLPAETQDLVLAPSGGTRVIFATNIAETTLTVPDVRVVVDAGLQKVARYDADRGLDSLDTERISLDAAIQRAGRAGRVAAGRAVRLWDERDRLRAHREPAIAVADLAAPVMDILAWGGDPVAFEWFEAPPDGALARALELLARLGATDGSSKLTRAGHDLRRLPLHPRLGRLLLAARGASNAALACALLSERRFVPPRSSSTTCDLLAAVDVPHALPPHVLRVAKDIRRTAVDLLGSGSAESIPEEDFRRAVLAAYPDRVGRRREAGSDRVLLASGSGARLGRESGVIDPEFIIAVDVTSGTAQRGTASDDVLIRMATGIEREWLTAPDVSVEHELDRVSGRVRAWRTDRYGRIVLRRTSAEIDPLVRASLLRHARIEAGPNEADRLLLRRLVFAGITLSFDGLVEAASHEAERLDTIVLAEHVPYHLRSALDRDAPSSLPLPSGRAARLDYRDDGRIVAAVKLQELFGLGETPRLGADRVPVTFELLAPNGRPVQVTSDLRSFWNDGYQEVRKELRARYPRHPWPEDPWTALPTHRTTRRS